MSDFRRIADTFYASPQIDPAQVAEAKAQGFTLIVNNRPDGEEAGQPEGAAIESAVREAGLDYIAIPVSSAGFSQPQVEALRDALDQAEGKVLGFCRSGTRSTFLWSLAQAADGAEPDTVAAAARGGGYDVSPIRPAMDALYANARG